MVTFGEQDLRIRLFFVETQGVIVVSLLVVVDFMLTCSCLLFRIPNVNLSLLSAASKQLRRMFSSFHSETRGLGYESFVDWQTVIRFLVLNQIIKAYQSQMTFTPIRAYIYS